jgi:carbonic anhydrase
MMREWDKVLLQNKAWAQEKLESDPTYFERTSKDQKPKYLWVGCSDSRVPANEVTNSDPGEIFVHRNIANVVVHTDLNIMSVLQYAVQYLEVEHIIVCGHYGCGGVRASMTHKSFGLLNKWLRNIKDVYRIHREELNTIADLDQRADRLAEWNVYEQVLNLAQTSIVQEAWHKHKRPHLHGWIYNMKDGLLKEIYHMVPGTPIDPIYTYDFSIDK